jgi:hypothetical protein
MSKINKNYLKVVALSALTTAATVFGAGKANAQQISDDVNGEWRPLVRAGISGQIPSESDSKVSGYTEQEGGVFKNPGLFVEYGKGAWGNLSGFFEGFLEVTGRMEVQSLRTKAYKIENIIANAGIGGDILYSDFLDWVKENIDPSKIKAETVNDFQFTLNFQDGLGYRKFLSTVGLGVGYHVDTKKQHGFVGVYRFGLGYRLNDNLKLNIDYRGEMQNTFNRASPNKYAPFNSEFQNQVELGFTYMLNKRCRGHIRNQ